MKYFIFLLRYNQWFKNHNGIKGFADQCMNALMQNTLKLAAKLKKQNRELSENIKVLSEKLNKSLLAPTIDADDYATLRKEIRNYTLLEWVIIIAESFFNYFAAKAIFTFPGWLGICAQLIFAIGVTWVSIPLFRNLFNQILHEPPYKGVNKEPRNWGKLSLLILFAIAYEYGMYALCKERGEQIEGGNEGFITTLMIVIGMLLPVLAGYFAYEKRKYYAAFKNTKDMERLSACIARKENKIQSNLQRMETHFKQECEAYWALLQKFNTFKENYNRKHSIPTENLEGHYCKDRDSFYHEAILRYQQQALDMPVNPIIVISNGQHNHTNVKALIEQ